MLCGAVMRAILFTVLATAGILSNAMAARDASAAMPLGARPNIAAAQTQPVANVCGANGCARVQTQRVVKHQKAGNFIPGRN
jgi:hypothetical protein